MSATLNEKVTTSCSYKHRRCYGMGKCSFSSMHREQLITWSLKWSAQGVMGVMSFTCRWIWQQCSAWLAWHEESSRSVGWWKALQMFRVFFVCTAGLVFHSPVSSRANRVAVERHASTICAAAGVEARCHAAPCSCLPGGVQCICRVSVLGGVQHLAAVNLTEFHHLMVIHCAPRS